MRFKSKNDRDVWAHDTAIRFWSVGNRDYRIALRDAVAAADAGASFVPGLQIIAEALGMDRVADHNFGFYLGHADGNGPFWSWGPGHGWVFHQDDLQAWVVTRDLGYGIDAWDFVDGAWIQQKKWSIAAPLPLPDVEQLPVCDAHKCSEVEHHNDWLDANRICPFMQMAESYGAHYAKIVRSISYPAAYMVLLDNIAVGSKENGQPVFGNEAVVVTKSHCGEMHVTRCPNSNSRIKAIQDAQFALAFVTSDEIIIKKDGLTGRWYCPPVRE